MPTTAEEVATFVFTNTTSIMSDVLDTSTFEPDDELVAGESGTLTKKQAESIKFAIYGVIMPAVCIIGICGNLMSVSIIYKIRDTTAFSTYLKALTISDTFVLLGGLARFVCDLIGTSVPSVSSQVNAYSKVIVSYILGKYAWGVSAFLIILMSAERFLAVAFPLHIKTFALESHPRVFIAGILCLQFLFRLPSAIWTEIRAIPDSQTNQTLYIAGYRDWAQNLQFRTNHFIIILIIFDMILPIVTTLFMNAAILVCLKRRTNLFSGESRVMSKTSLEDRRLTLTLLLLSAFYLLSMTPNMATNLMKVTINDYGSFRARERPLLSTILNINILMVTLNSANDFTIYILSSKRFRQLFKKTYFGRCYKTEGKRYSCESSN